MFCASCRKMQIVWILKRLRHGVSYWFWIFVTVIPKGAWFYVALSPQSVVQQTEIEDIFRQIYRVKNHFLNKFLPKWGFMFSTTFGFSSNYFSCTSLDFNYCFMHFIKRWGPYHWWLRFILPPNTNQWSFLHGVSNRARRALENRTMIDDDRIAIMEDQLKQAKYIAEEREQMYEEVCYTVRPN